MPKELYSKEEYKFNRNDKPDGEKTHFKLQLDEKDNMPVKIGDGSFGMVFAAKESDGPTKYALKVLYQRALEGDGDESLDRIKGELKVGSNLPKRVSEVINSKEFLQNPDDTFIGADQRTADRLVLPIAYKEDFEDFNGKNELSEKDVEFTTYAYLMPRFESSLKDLVERTKDTAASGYQQLEKVSKIERQASSIPVIKHVAEGLQTLHAASLRHQDIKPANIYYRQDGQNVEFKLGDLGFLQRVDSTNIGKGTGVVESIGIGTKHYRSVEQIDYADVAECEVQVKTTKESKNGQTIIELKTFDPKFQNTIIKPGDFARFARSNSRRKMIVEEVTVVKEGGHENENHVRIVLRDVVGMGTDIEGREESNIPYFDDAKTQVEFFKNPTAKTDLFGLAGILYDIISAGDSPERLYELLRQHDKKGTGIQQSILDKYTQWQAGTLDDASIGAIFSRVNGGDSQGDQVINQNVLAFLLKCMMSDADDSFYRSHKFDSATVYSTSGNVNQPNTEEISARYNAVVAWGKILVDVKNLESQLEEVKVRNYFFHKNNILTRSLPNPGEDTDGSFHRTDKRSLANLIDDIESGEIFKQHNAAPEQDDLATNDESLSDSATPSPSAEKKQNKSRNWLIVAPLLDKMIAGLNSYINENTDYFYSLAPEHIAVKETSVAYSKPVITNNNVTKHPSDSLTNKNLSIPDQLRARNPLIVRSSKFSNRYEPIWWRHGTRKLKISNIEQITDSPKKFHAKIQFADFAMGNLEISEGDFILPDNLSNVFVIDEVSKIDNLVTMSVAESGGDFDDSEKQLRDALTLRSGSLIKRPNSYDYYGGMLALYIFHLIISDGPNINSNISDFPRAVYSRVVDFPVQFTKSPSSIDRNPLLERTSQLIVWLSLGGFCYDESGGLLEGGDIRKWHNIQKEVQGWIECVKLATRCDRLLLDAKLLSGPDMYDESLKEFLSSDSLGELTAENWNSYVDSYLDLIKSRGSTASTNENEGGFFSRFLS